MWISKSKWENMHQRMNDSEKKLINLQKSMQIDVVVNADVETECAVSKNIDVTINVVCHCIQQRIMDGFVYEEPVTNLVNNLAKLVEIKAMLDGKIPNDLNN